MSNPYVYLAKNVPFVELPKEDFESIGKKFKKLYDAANEDFWELGLTDEGYETLAKTEYQSKDELFTAIDKATYNKNNSVYQNVTNRKLLIGIYQNIDKLLKYDEKYGTSYWVPIFDPLWNGLQDEDGFYIHHKDGVWFVSKTSTQDELDAEIDDDDEYWDYVSHTRADPESDLKQYYLERDNL